MSTTRKASDAVVLLLIGTVSAPGCARESPTAAVRHPWISAPSLASSPGPDILVNTTSDVADFGGGQQVGDLPGPDGLLSLREAIIAANNTTGAQVIGFDIPTSDAGFDGTVFTIKPQGSELPALVDNGTTIDGTCQTISSGETNPLGPEIVLDGSQAGPGTGIHVFSNNNVIRGLVINSFENQGIDITGGTGTRVEGNFIGTDRTGTLALGNRFGILVNEASSNLIGGTKRAARNLVSGNTDHGIAITGNGNRVVGNLIGTDITGNNPLPNGGLGVQIVFNARGNIIKQNLIAFNASDGIAVGFSAVANTITKNAIFSNSGLGIDLGSGGADDFHGDGLTANDPGDTDNGPNNLQNFPVLSSAIATRGQLTVEGLIDSPDPRSIAIEFFANAVPTPGGDPTGHGEGAVFLGTVALNRGGRFTADLPAVAVGTLITATATDAEGSTSEFSAYVTARPPRP